jgi:predicted enzyme related to lactoylglutathione lyase
MPEVAVFTPSTPVWVDVTTSDVERTNSFYSGLFGWKPEVMPGPESGGYTMFTVDGKFVAAASPAQSPEQPSAWMIYFGTRDADQTASKITEAGGKAVAPPFDVMDAGRMGVFQDPTGAHFSIWQPGRHQGMMVAQEPNTYAWTELNTRGFDRVKPFYQAAFGWTAKTSPMGEGQPAYTEWQLDGTSIAGGMEMVPSIPAEVPPHWLVYFAAADVDAASEKATGLGAKTLMPAMDFPGGRFAILQDPQGAVFGVLQMRG